MKNNVEKQAFMCALRQCLSLKFDRNAEKLAQETNLSTGYISQLKKGTRYGEPKTRAVVARACGYDYDDFIEFGRQALMQVGEIEPEYSVTPAARIDALEKQLEMAHDQIGAYKDQIEMLKEQVEYQKNLASEYWAALKPYIKHKE